MSTPRVTSSATIAAVNGRAALGISALPGVREKMLWYASIPTGRAVARYWIGRPWATK